MIIGEICAFVTVSAILFLLCKKPTFALNKDGLFNDCWWPDLNRHGVATEGF